ncbi:DUF1054 family protein, partial [Staphylococcus aureus]|uniref:DUF1054 family protein n=1 Tax=Staphylococcus aureus TaxID=1280 RepID=UPI0037D9E80F
MPPQLHQLPQYFTHFFTTQTPQTFYPHLPNHARRTLNPPKHTSLPFPTNKTPYKILPHFQIPIFQHQLFLIFPIIHQPKHKPTPPKLF